MSHRLHSCLSLFGISIIEAKTIFFHKITKFQNFEERNEGKKVFLRGASVEAAEYRAAAASANFGPVIVQL